MKIFLSGSKTARNLPKTLTDLLDDDCSRNVLFLIGDCFGADALMQDYLRNKHYTNVTVYASGQRIRHHAGYPVRQIPVPEGISGFEFYRQKDLAMIQDCDEAVMLWDGKTRGTRCNIQDMQRLNKNCIVIMIEEEKL